MEAANRISGEIDMNMATFRTKALSSTTALLLASAALGGCDKTQDASSTTVVVDFRVDVCVEGGARCFSLGVPGAEVELLTPEGTQFGSGTTDDTGTATIISTKVGLAVIVVQSPLIKQGRKETQVMLPAGSHHTSTIHAPLSAEVTFIR